MKPSERRTNDREMYQLPLRFRNINDRGDDILEGETMNLSRGGVFFATNQRMRKGQEIEMFLTLPSEMTGRGPMPVRCEARVVHVQRRTLSNGLSGIGARFLRSEPTITGQKKIA